MTKILIDPPSGWRYGYPKELPAELEDATDNAVALWLVENGYPQALIDQGMLKHCRYIWIEKDGENNATD